MTDRPSVTDDVRAEAMSRYSFGTYHGQMVQWHDAKKLAVDAFIAGAEWAAARAETTATEPCPDPRMQKRRRGDVMEDYYNYYDSYECCASGSCEVCGGLQGMIRARERQREIDNRDAQRWPEWKEMK